MNISVTRKSNGISYYGPFKSGYKLQDIFPRNNSYKRNMILKNANHKKICLP